MKTLVFSSLGDFFVTYMFLTQSVSQAIIEQIDGLAQLLQGLQRVDTFADVAALVADNAVDADLIRTGTVERRAEGLSTVMYYNRILHYVKTVTI